MRGINKEILKVVENMPAQSSSYFGKNIKLDKKKITIIKIRKFTKETNDVEKKITDEKNISIKDVIKAIKFNKRLILETEESNQRNFYVVPYRNAARDVDQVFFGKREKR